MQQWLRRHTRHTKVGKCIVIPMQDGTEELLPVVPESNTWELCSVMAGLRMKISNIVSAVQSCNDIGSYASYMGNTVSVSSTGFHFGEHVYGPVLAILLQLLASVKKE